MALKTQFDTNKPWGETGAKRGFFFLTFDFGVFPLKLRGCYNSRVGRPSVYQPVVSVLHEIDLCERADAAQSAGNSNRLGDFDYGRSAAF
jgi:hypothetical protein